MKTTFNDVGLKLTETRKYAAGAYDSRHGKSTIDLTCPFCDADTTAYVWSLAGGGKRCANEDCGALFGSWGCAYKLKSMIHSGNEDDQGRAA